MFRFTIREFVFLTVIVGMGVAWFIDHQRQAAANHETEMLDWKFRTEALKEWMGSGTIVKVEFKTDSFGQEVRITNGSQYSTYREKRLRSGQTASPDEN
jgi:hypothetical protein